MLKQLAYIAQTIALLACVAIPVHAATFYVSPKGDDHHPGTLDKPFATLEKARDAIRALKQAGGLPDGGVTVWLRGGEYARTEPFTLTPDDSGEEGKPVVFAAHPGEQPVLFGGRRITGLRPAAGGVWEASLLQAKDGRWVFRTLYVNGRRYTLARSPNHGYYEMAGAVPTSDSLTEGPDSGKSRNAFRAPPEAMGDWPAPGDINLKVWGRWWTSLLMVRHIDPATGVVQLAGADKQYLPYRHRKKTPFIIENHPGALDEPGEWQLDRKQGVLRVIPRPGDDLGKAEVYAPVADRLLVLAGEPAQSRYVRHVVFRGIGFCCTNWTLTPESTGAQADVAVGAMVEGTGLRDCLFEGCEFTKTDSYALWLRRGSRECVVRKCHLHDLGAGGVKVGETLPEDDAIRAGSNTVENCFIHNGGHVHGSGIGVWIGASSDNLITHNEICDFWYSGVSVGWKWSADLYGTRNNRVTFNRIHHVMQRLEDGGGIYCLGFQPQALIANNIIHDSGRDGGPPHCRGIYLDQGCVGFLVENNLVYDTQDAALRMQIGTGCNIYINNILAFTREYAVDMDVARSCVFVNNIVYLDRGRLYKYEKWPNYEKFIDKNVYWRTDDQPFLFAGETLEKWREHRQTGLSYFKGTPMDDKSVVADPRFVDAPAKDFRLKPGSPAIHLGFKPFDLDSPGLTGDDAWRTLPSRTRVPIPADDNANNTVMPANATTPD
jgi:hypothetical protein